MASITVNATGSVPVTEHRAEVHLRLEATAGLPGEALTALAGKIARLRGLLSERAVADDRVATEHLDVQPRWGEHGRADGAIAGTTVRVSLPSVDEVGALLDAALTAVGDGASVQHVGQVPVTTPALEAQARAEAVEAARAQAQELAAAAGGALGGLLSLLEAGPGAPAPFYAMAPNTGAVYRPKPHLWEAHDQVHVSVTAVYELVEPA